MMQLGNDTLDRNNLLEEFKVEIDGKIISSKTKVILDSKTGLMLAIISRPQRNIINVLYNNAGIIFSKQDIKDIGWPGRIVSNSSVVVAISEIRSIIGNNKIITISGEGYLFNNLL
ncbi:winged helix-turn-helix domain-containing protein [Moritella sp. Urea-trap-13]|uniref:winged helix-turn-helix domain-containing protein n=1 Tax=Moritella sp. Urea-trap-13 TaxID=2058327 RepID=UPI001E37446D|nr:winged helix-turn-helix domain-containing protein [Moritella sp. Urea-trap-13]